MRDYHTKTALLHCDTATTLAKLRICDATLPQHHTTTRPQYHNTAPRYHSTTEPQYHRTTVQRYHSTAVYHSLPHYHVATLPSLPSVSKTLNSLTYPLSRVRGDTTVASTAGWDPCQRGGRSRQSRCAMHRPAALIVCEPDVAGDPGAGLLFQLTHRDKGLSPHR